MLSVVKLHDVTHLSYHLISNIYHFQSVRHIYTVFTTMIDLKHKSFLSKNKLSQCLSVLLPSRLRNLSFFYLFELWIKILLWGWKRKSYFPFTVSWIYWYTSNLCNIQGKVGCRQKHTLTFPFPLCQSYLHG